MKFLSLEIENFLTVSSIKANLADKGLVLIQGENKDDTSQDSNGSGKSSFVDALCWCLYGETARGLSGDGVVNDTAAKNCRVGVTIDIDGDQYQIARHRKYAKHRNRLHVFDPKGVDLTLGTDKLTQEVVDKLIGSSADVFCASVYSGQENTPDLPGMTDINLKAIVEEAAGINELEEAHKLAKQRRSDSQKAVDEEAKKLSFQNMRLTELESDKKEAESSLEDWNAKKVADLKDSKATLVAGKSEFDDMKAAFDSSHREISSVDGDLATLKSALDGLNSEKTELAKLEKIANEATTAVKIIESKLEAQKVATFKAKDEFDSISGLVGEDCTECGRTHDDSTVGEAAKSAKQKVKDSANEFKKLKVSVADSVKLREIADNEVLTFKASMTSIDETIDKQNALNAEKIEISKAAAALASAKQKLANAAANYKAKSASENPYQETLDKVEGRITATLKNIAEHRANIKELETALELATEVVHVFGPAGVRAHILDNVTPLLNTRTSEYLTILSDGNIQAEWNTLGTTGKGEIREKFNIEVCSHTGGDSFKKLSGGEKRKVRLATSMALQDLVASRATKPIDLFIADEVDAAIDESGLERLMTILKQKADDVGTVLVISHSDLKSWISNSVTVVKESGVATLEGGAL